MNIQNSIKFSGNRLKQFILALAVGVGLVAGSALAAPVNDNFADAITLTGDSATQTGTGTVGATFETGEPVAAYPDTLHTVWFKWTAPSNGNFTIATTGSTDSISGEFDSIIGAFTGLTVGALTAVVAPQDTALEETISFAVTSGTTYYFQVGGDSGNTEAANVLLNWTFVSAIQAKIETFGPDATIGAVVANAATIAWTVPFVTNLATLAPTFTLSPGASCTVNGIPIVSGATEDFTNPVHYIVKSSNNLITNDYTVTVAHALNESALVWNVGSGDWDFTPANWLGQTSNTVQPFSNGLDVIFNNSSGGAINIAASVTPHTTTVSATSGTYTFSGQPVTTGSITKDGGGTLAISSWNSYSGGTIVNNGTLYISWPGDANPKTSLGSGPVTLYGGTIYLFRTLLANPLIVNGGTLLAENGFGNTWTGPITLNATFNCDIHYTLECSGVISGTFGLNKTSGGPLILSGINTYTGPTTVTGGTLEFGNVNALGSGALSISPGAKVKLNYSGEHNVASLSLGGVAQASGTYGSTASNATNKNDTYFAGTGTVKAPPPPLIVQPVAATAQSYYSGDDRAPIHAFDGTGMTPSSPVTAASTCNTATGGNVWLSNGNVNTWITFDVGSVQTLTGFHLWNYNESGALSGRGVKTAGIYVGASLPANGSTYASAGPNWGTLAQNFTFTQAPGANGYTGEDYTFTTPVTGRYIQIYVTSNFGTFDSYTGISEIRFYKPYVPEANILAFGPGASIGPVSANAANIAWYLPNGTNSASLSPTFTLSTGATCKVNGNAVVSGATFDFTSPVHYIVTSSDNLITTDYTVTVTVAPNDTTLIWDVGSGVWDISTTPNWKGQNSNMTTVYFNGENVIFNKSGGGTITIASDVAPLTTTVDSSGTYSLGGALLGGVGTLTKSGNGQLRMLKQNNTYSGGTIIYAGELYLEPAGSENALGTGLVTLNGGVLHLDRFVLTNSLTVNGGSLILDNGFGDTGTGPITLNVQLNVTALYTNHPFSGNISGPGGITMTSYSGGVMNLSGTNTYTGPTTVLSGTMEFGNVDALGSGALSVAAGGATVLLNYSGDHIVASLTLGGTVMPPGTYGYSNQPAYFTGTGTVTVKAPGYAAWQAANGGTTQTLDQDLNNDGVANGIVYFTYGPVANSGFTPLPGVATALDGTLSVTWTKGATYAGVYGTDYFVETSKNLTDWGIEIAEPNAGSTVTFPTPTTVKFTFPTPLDPANFVRLRVTGP